MAGTVDLEYNTSRNNGCNKKRVELWGTGLQPHYFHQSFQAQYSSFFSGSLFQNSMV
ncbi:conserved hypothetical protein [Ricinus communis]|uniref:Uncharacterized protein n=1 Tax=Ricinus communis TaxID=3988 RepID=B9SX70_RICCO|nr:conserved hypothetical protein [Ricinus communis]